MYDEIINNLKKQLPISELNKLKGKNIHLGVFSYPYLTYMLEGKKTIESRFSKNKVAPYNQITDDDIVIIKKSSGDVLGYFTIKNLLFFDLNTISISVVLNHYHQLL